MNAPNYLLMNKLFLVSCIGRVGGSLSLLGSGSIIYMILSDWKKKLARPYQRLMLLMSIFDVIQSLAFVVNVTAFPQGSNIYGAKGNWNTCSIQGFLMMLGLSVPLYNSCLNIFYVLTINYSLSPEQFAKFEPALHAVAIFVPICLAILNAAYGNTVPRGTICYPRGKGPLIIVLSIIVICYLICIISMVCICRRVITQQKKMEIYRHRTRRKSSASRTRAAQDAEATIKQALLYALAFFLTYSFPTSGSIYLRGEAERQLPFVIVILTNIFYPLQGFWNYLFYVRPGVHHVMVRCPEKSYFGAVREVMFNPESLTNNRRQPRRLRTLSPLTDIIDTVPVKESISLSSLFQTDDVCFGVASATGGLNGVVNIHSESEVKTQGLPFAEHKNTAIDGIIEIQNEIPVTHGATRINMSDEDLEAPSGAQPTPKRQSRRVSLVRLSSILNEDFADLDLHYNSDEE